MKEKKKKKKKKKKNWVVALKDRKKEKTDSDRDREAGRSDEAESDPWHRRNPEGIRRRSETNSKIKSKMNRSNRADHFRPRNQKRKRDSTG